MAVQGQLFNPRPDPIPEKVYNLLTLTRFNGFHIGSGAFQRLALDRAVKRQLFNQRSDPILEKVYNLLT